jgi:hypothetical protein
MVMTLIPLMLLVAVPDPDLSWLAGNWCTEPKNDTRTCESWTPMEKGVMRGKGITRKAERVSINEAMTITADASGIVFHAEPANQKPADFRAVEFSTEGQAIAFEDRSHDYPQRVRYWRDGEALLAETSQSDGSKVVRWTFRRTPE